jgi:H+/gluconate symporter-like permease
MRLLLLWFLVLVAACCRSAGAAAQQSPASEASTSPPAAEQIAVESGQAAEEHETGRAAPSSPPAQSGSSQPSLKPVFLVVIGIVSVLAMIIGLKLNAFLALILSALIVSLGVGLMEGTDSGARMNAVVDGFGETAKGIGIVIAMAAIIGKCMLDSGAADRIVRTAVKVTGERKASLGLMISGFILAIPVFFDTVFYLLVPLARSLYRRTNKNYLLYVMAIATGGAVTHTLVPPTPGPLLVAAILGVDVGMMMVIGTLVAFPSAVAGLLYSILTDRRMPIPMRPLGGGDDKHQPLPEERLPSLAVSMLPVLLPVVLISFGTLAMTIADREDRAKLAVEDIFDFNRLAALLSEAEVNSPAGRVMASGRLSAEDRERLVQPPTSHADQELVVEALNKVLQDDKFYDEDAFRSVALSSVSKSLLVANQMRMKPVDRRRMNRKLLEDAYPELFHAHVWETPKREWSNRLGLWSNANFALTLAAICAMLTLKHVRALSWRSLGDDVEISLMSGGVIILITAAGGAFGAMLQDTDIRGTIQSYFTGSSAAGITLLLLGWGIAAVLKIAQGSSTVAMIVAAGMMAAIIGEAKPDYHMVYVGIAVGCGSLLGSWMNDSGFWVFAKMGGLTEEESLRTWTPLLIVLSVVGLVVTVVLSELLPLKP